MKTNVYIDGFNLFYGALKDSPHRWLNIASLAQKLAPKGQIVRVRYFTARISSRPGHPHAPLRQQSYLRALATLPGVSLHFGHFLITQPFMPLANPPATGPKTVKVIKTEEKGSDVNLATYLLVDAFTGDFDQAIVVSNDSDLCEPIRIVRDDFGLPVHVVNPHKTPSQALKEGCVIASTAAGGSD